MNEIIRERISLLLKGDRAVIAIDGNCASGKSTLADEIQRVFGGTVIRADSFFLPSDMRTPDRLAQPGGNFHRERFCAEVVSGIKQSAPFSYGVYDCKSGAITRHTAVNEKKLVIIEGSYCMHPLIGFDYDLKIFCTTEPHVQLSRIEKRNGEEAVPMFTEKWIPLENKYFETFYIQNICDITVVT